MASWFMQTDPAEDFSSNQNEKPSGRYPLLGEGGWGQGNGMKQLGGDRNDKVKRANNEKRRK
jgi:hypothetical protein